MRWLAGHETTRVDLVPNGSPVHGLAEPRLLLSDFPRDVIGASGTHVGCVHGVCGACTVRIEALLARVCLVLSEAPRHGTWE